MLFKVGPLTVDSGQVAAVRNHAFGGVVVELRDGRRAYSATTGAQLVAEAQLYAPAAAVLAKAPGTGA